MYKLFEIQLPGWKNPILLRALDEIDAIELARIFWKIPTDQPITAIEITK